MWPTSIILPSQWTFPSTHRYFTSSSKLELRGSARPERGQAGYDSVAVPETSEIVVYLRHQAVPRYVIYFERQEYVPPERLLPFETSRTVPIADGRYLQRMSAGAAAFGSNECERCLGVQATEPRLGTAPFTARLTLSLQNCALHSHASYRVTCKQPFTGISPQHLTTAP